MNAQQKMYFSHILQLLEASHSCTRLQIHCIKFFFANTFNEENKYF